jgi:aldehyde:ferredoxin oxidoreductase
MLAKIAKADSFLFTDKMASIKEVLSKMGEGKTVNTISKELDIRESTLRAMLEFTVEQGYLEEIDCESKCMSCPMKCGMPMNIKMYMLTKKGKEYIKG